MGQTGKEASLAYKLRNELLGEGEGVIGMDYVQEVSTRELYQWDPNDELSQPWTVASGNDTGPRRSTLPPVRFRIAAYDYGMKQNILRLLRQKGFGVTVVPASTTPPLLQTTL
jgi:carbamoyl-phosphate synthase small subunit